MIYLALFIGLIIIVLTTELIQKFKLSQVWLLVGQISASLIIIIVGKLEILYIRYISFIELSYLTIPFSLLFLVGFTNVMNIRKRQKLSILVLPCISLVCLSISAVMMDHTSVFIIGIASIIAIMILLLYGYKSGKVKIGTTVTTSISFVIAVLSLSLFKLNVATLYIPIFTLALPFTLYLFIQKKLTSADSYKICVSIALFFSFIMFVIPFDTLWYFVIGLTVSLAVSQFFQKYRFI